MTFKSVKIGLITALSCVSMSASALVSWNFNIDIPVGHEYIGDDGSTDVTVSGWAEEGTLVDRTSSVKRYSGSGLGIDRPGESNPQHAVDNSGPDEFLLFDFDNKEVSVTGYSFGWYSGDNDSTVLYWNGAGSMDSNTDISGKTISQLSAQGWALAGNYYNDSSVDTTGQTQVTNNEIYSSHWIIGAYMNTFGSNSSHYGGNDYFKFKTLAVKVAPDAPNASVPAPAPLALMAAGLVLLGTRRRKH